jgi:hypothetical protein
MPGPHAGTCARLKGAEQRFIEGRDVGRLAAGNQVSAHHDIHVDDIRTGIAQICSNGRP